MLLRRVCKKAGNGLALKDLDMKSVPLKAFVRTQTGRLDVKKLRATGRVPAVIYGNKTQSQNLEIIQRELDDMIHHSASENVLVDLTVEGDAKPKRLALVQDVQHYALTGKVLHVDFHEVAADETVTMTIPVETRGEAIGVKTGGGVLEHVLFKVRVKGTPLSLPEVIVVDVTEMQSGQTIHLGELPCPEGVEILGDPKVPVIAVAAPRVEVATETAAPTEVEAIKEKKDPAKK